MVPLGPALKLTSWFCHLSILLLGTGWKYFLNSVIKQLNYQVNAYNLSPLIKPDVMRELKSISKINFVFQKIMVLVNFILTSFFFSYCKWLDVVSYIKFSYYSSNCVYIYKAVVLQQTKECWTSFLYFLSLGKV